MSALAKAHERKFGVEIECGHPVGYQEVASLMRGAGFRIGHDYARGYYNVGHDGSGVEVRTPHLKGKDGFAELKAVFDFLNSIGCYVTTRDGMHVHHDAPELTQSPALVLKLVQEFIANRDPIVEMVAPSRRARGPYNNWNRENVRLIEDWVRTTGSPVPNPQYRPNSRYAWERARHLPVTNTMPRFGRCDLNTDALTEHGTVEWRLHEGCLNYDQAKAWIMFVQKFMHRAITGKTPVRVRTRADLLRQIRLTKPEREAIDLKFANADYPPSSGAQFVNGR